MDAHTLALGWLARRELSVRQVRERLERRDFPSDAIDETIHRLIADRTLDDRRVALAAVRTDALVHRRGRRRILQRLQQLGIARDLADAALAEVLDDIDEAALLDQAIVRSLRGQDAAALDRKAVARVVRRLAGQGFAPGAVYARLRRKGVEADE